MPEKGKMFETEGEHINHGHQLHTRRLRLYSSHQVRTISQEAHGADSAQ